MKQFKSKRIKKRKKAYVYLFIFFFVFSYVFALFFSSKYKLDKNVLDNEINYINFDIKKYLSDKTDSIINNPVNLLNSNIKKVSYNNIKKIKVATASIKETEVSAVDEYKPLIYIYNTHQTERYEDYGVTEASSYLTSKLNEIGISTCFEEQSIPTFLQTNNMKYYKSYTVSRKYLDEAKQKYPSIIYFFDIHRDALSKEKSTIVINKKSYAKILFIVGKDNKFYESNLNNAKKLNKIINDLAPGITRGVITKGGAGVNGVYNQDVSSNSFLIEVGGNNNTKEEVINTVNVIYKAITEYVRGVI